MFRKALATLLALALCASSTEAKRVQFLVSRTAVVAAVTLDPAHTAAKLTLSGGNLTETANASDLVNGSVSRSTTSHSTGKYYVEVTVGPMSTNTNSVGIISGSQAVDANYLGETGFLSLGYYSGAHVYVNAASVAAYSFYFQADIVAVAIDFTNNLIWFRVNNGNWNNNGSADPATGAGGFDISVLSGSPFFFGVENDKINESMTVNFGGTAFTYTKPTGFSVW